MSTRSGSIDELLVEAGFLRRVARGLASDAFEADDLVQDTFVAALEHPPSGGGSVRGWLATVAANLSRNKRREGSRRQARELIAARNESVEDEVVSQEKLELQKALFELLLALPSEQRMVVYLRYYEERTPVAIAEKLGVPLGTVKTRHTRAMASLRERLDARSGGDRQVWMEALLVPSSALPTSGTASGVVATTIGGIAMKKLVVVVVAASFAALTWFAMSGAPRLEPVAANGPSMPSKLDESPAKSAPSMEQASTPAREPVATMNKISTGTLEVHLFWSDSTPAASVGIGVQCINDPAPRQESLRAITDSNGIARFDALFAGQVTLIPDMRERFEGEVEAGTTRTIAHTLEKGEEVRGHVVDPAGSSVANAWIWCKGADWNCPDTIRAMPCALDGTFRLRDVIGRARIDARAPHFRGSPCFDVANIVVGPSGVREIELMLGERGGRVDGHVLDPDGKPLRHAFVLAGPRGGGMKWGTSSTEPQPGTVETDAEGAFEIVDDLAPGRQPIFATAHGFPVWEGTINVAVGATTSVEIVLARGARIEGRVIGLDDRPIAGIKVIASKEERGGWYFEMLPASTATSDAEGRFALDWVRPGECEINAEDYMRPGAGRGQMTVTCVAGETTTVDVKLERGNTISGTVKDEEGAPLAGWSVYAESAVMVNQWYPRQTKSAADGSFTLINLGPGSHDLLVRSPEFEVAPRGQTLRVPVGTKDVVIVVKDAKVARGILRARIIDPSGHSLKDLEVTLWKTGANIGSALDVEPVTGVVESPVQPAHYRIRARRTSVSLFTSDEFVVSENQITDAGDLSIGRTGRAEIRITGVPKELEHFNISLQGPNREESAALGWEDGMWKSKDLAAGQWLVTWHESNLWIRDAAIDVPAGATSHFDVVAEPAHSVEISFVNSGEGTLTIETRNGDGKITSFRRVGFDSGIGRTTHSIPLPAGRNTIELHTLEGLTGKVDVDVPEAWPLPGKKPDPPIEIPLH